MTAYLPPNLLALFAARDPIPFAVPIERPKHHRPLPYTGIAQYVKLFEDPSETPIPPKVETREEKRERKRKEKAEQIAYKVEQDLALWNPNEIPTGTKDPYKTLFVARINYDTTESKIKREFEGYGPIKTIRMVKNAMNNKPRGYCFIEYEHERDMHAAYKNADGKKIDGHRVLVDVERARTVRNWRPRRLGGGLGNTRRGPPEQNSKYTTREEPRERDSDRRKRSRSREKDRRDRDRDKEKEKEKDKDKDRDRERDRDKERDRKRDRDRDHETRGDRNKRKRSRSKEHRKHRSRSRGKSKDRSTDRSKDKKRKKDKDREKERENGVVSAAIRQYGEYGADME